MIKKLATTVSVLFHPLLMPTIGLLVIFNTNSHVAYIPIEYRRTIMMIVFVSSCILPLSIIPLFLQMGIIKTIQMVSPRERILPLLSTGICLLIGYYFLRRFQLPNFIPLFILGTLTTIILSMAISAFWKISIHMVGIGGLIGALLALTFKYGINTTFWMLLGIFFSGLIGSARLYLNAHSSSQVYAGLLLGISVVLGVVML